MLPYVTMNATGEVTKARKGARVLFLLAFLNLISIADRYMIPDLQPLIKSEFHLSDSAVGVLSSAFFLTFMASMPVAIWWGRRCQLKIMTCGAALLWSCFTVFSALSKSYGALLINHALFAIGEASFAIFAPVIIAEFYPADKRHRALMVFSLTVPLGTAAAFALASLAHHHGWRPPLYWLATLGAIAAGWSALLIKAEHRALDVTQNQSSAKAMIKSLMLNARYLATVGGGCCLAFSMVGLAVWLPTLLTRTTGRPLADVNRILGLITVVSGGFGVLLGGGLADYWLRRNPSALYLVSALSMTLGGLCAALTVFAPANLAFPAAATAQLCFFLNVAPMGAAILNSVSPSLRAFGLALSMFIGHALGDGISPTLIGWIADHSSLRVGLAIALIPLGFGTFALLRGARAMASDPAQA